MYDVESEDFWCELERNKRIGYYARLFGFGT